MKTAKPLPAGLYFRVSTGEQHADNQRPEVEALAARAGLEVVLVEEEAVSTRKARPAWDRVMAAARAGKIRAVVVWALDRLGRSMVGNLETVLELDKLGVRVLSVREAWLDTAGPTRALLVAIFSWIAEQERDQRSERTKAGLRRVKAKGVKLGRPSKVHRVNVTAAASLHQQLGSWPKVAKALGVSEGTLSRARRVAVALAPFRRHTDPIRNPIAGEGPKPPILHTAADASPTRSQTNGCAERPTE